MIVDKAKLKEFAEKLIEANERLDADETGNEELGDAWSIADDHYLEVSGPEVALALLAEIDELRKDAERLSWLDESKEVDSVGPTLCCGKHRPTLREAIDIAMSLEK